MENSFRFQVNIGGIIDLLSQHLYSSPRVFVRELLQNAVDAITARNLQDPSGEAKITVELITGEQPVIKVTDTGTGLTLDEIHKFLSIIGESSKRENLTNTDFIGRFGIGLLSGFLVSDEIILETRSAKSDKGYTWHGRHDGLYTIEDCDRTEIGSTVILNSNQDNVEYFEETILYDLISFYGDILPYPVYLSVDGTEPVQINDSTPPWLTPELSSPLDVMNFGEDYFGENFMGYIPLKSKTGNVEGVAYILNRRVVPGSKTNHRVYLRNMLLSETGKGLLPDWAFFVRVVVNAQTLRPTASREDFYEDGFLEQTREELGEIIKDYLKNMAEDNPDLMDKFMNEHHIALKALAIEDENILQTFVDYFLFETSLGTFTFKEIRESSDVIRFVSKVDDFRQMSAVFGSNNQLLVNAGYVYDDDLMNAIDQSYMDVTLERLSPEDALFAMTDLNVSDNVKYKNLVEIAAINLQKWDCKIEIKQFSPNELPALLLVNEDASFMADLKYSKENSNDLFASLLGQFEKKEEDNRMILCLNANNILIKKLADKTDIDTSVFDLIYVQSILLARRPLRRKEMSALNNGILNLLEKSI